MNGLLIGMAAAMAAPQPSDLKTFQDWTIGCDNGRACQAVGLVPASDDSWDEHATTAVITREAGANDAPQIFISAGPKPYASATIDGQRFALKPERPGVDSGAYRPTDPARFLAAFLKGKQAELTDTSGKTEDHVSAAGLTAAMLYMDEQQKRAGTQTAIVRKGPRPASSMPPAPPLPMVRATLPRGAKALAISAAETARIDKESGCSDGRIDEEKPRTEIVAIDASHSLILIDCGHGAYNFSTVPYIAARANGRTRIALAQFDSMPGWGVDNDTPELVNAIWEPKTGELSHYAKGRGLGDCGSGQTFVWDGTRFRLIKQIEMGECRGSIDWIPTWRAKAVAR